MNVSPQDRLFFRRLPTDLSVEPGENVAVVANASDRDLAELLDHVASGRVYVFSDGTAPEWNLAERKVGHVQISNLNQAHWQFKRFGPFDLVIDRAHNMDATHGQMWRRLFFHVKRGGAYLIDRSDIPDKEWAALVRLLTEVAPLGDFSVGEVRKRPRLSDAVASLVLDRDALLIIKRDRHWVKLRNEQADRFLPTRDDQVDSRLIMTAPSGEFVSRADLHLHVASRELPHFDQTFKYPERYLHEYRGDVTVASHSLVFAPNTILPESFRYQQVPRLTNVKLDDVSADFAKVPDGLVARRELSGSYFHLDSPFSGHFGHIMTEVVSRLWAWETAKQDIPDLRALFRIYRGRRVPTMETALFEAAGIKPDDVVWVDEPVRVSSLVGATPMWQNQHPHYVHPDIMQTWERLRDGLIADEVVPERIFVSRAAGLSNRICRNVGELEKYFAERGFEIVYPERLGLAQQATVFGGARVIAGLAGSAMFNVLFGRKLEQLIVLSHEGYTARNEYLYASVLGCETHYVWSRPDVEHKPDEWLPDAFNSAWEFDFERNRRILDEITRP